MTKPQKASAEWVARVDQLLDQIQEWAQEQKWWVQREAKELREEDLGAYQTSVLMIQSPQGRLMVEPIARSIVGADGRVDLCAFPSLNRILLLRKGDDWRFRTDSGVTLRRRWNRKNFLELALDLMRTP